MANTITIGGATAKDWINTGAINLIADPAGGLVSSTIYDKLNHSNADLFDAKDRDKLVTQDPNHQPPFGIGVYTKEAIGKPGTTSKPTEIGYYSGIGDGDKLTIELAQPLTNGEITTSFFYSDENGSAERLRYQLFYQGKAVSDTTLINAQKSGVYKPFNAGFFTFKLPSTTIFDKVLLTGTSDSNLIDASDFLLESISGQKVADLAISEIATSDLIWTGNPYTVNYTEKNQSSGDSPTHQTNFYISQDNNLDANDTLVSSVNEDALAAGQSRSVSQSITLPNTLKSGNYYLLSQADSSNAVIETDETNNIQAKPIEVKVSLPDLTISDLAGPDLVWAGNSYTVSYTAKNQGLVDSAANVTKFYISQDNTLDNSDILVSSVNEDALAAGQSRSVSQSITLPNTIQPGNYYLLTQADGNNGVSETDETNNVQASPIEFNQIQRRQFDLNFNTTNQSLWKTGQQYTLNSNRFIGIDFDKSYEKSIGLFGNRAGIRAQSQIKAGLQSNLQVNGGALNASLPIQLWLDLPKKVKAGDTITIKSGFSLDPSASFSTTTPSASYSLDAVLKLNNGIQAFFNGSNYNLFGAQNIDRQVNLVNLNSDKVDFNLPISSYGEINLKSPKINTTDNASDGVLSAQTNNSFLKTKLDIDRIITDAFGLPPLGGSFKFDPGYLMKISGDYNILDLGLNANLSLKQKLNLSPDNLTGQLTLENGETQNFKVGDDIKLTVPNNVGNSLDLNASLNLGASLTNNTDLGYEIGGSVKALEANLEGSIATKISYPVLKRKGWRIRIEWQTKEITLAKGSMGFGPLVNEGISYNNDMSLYQDKFALGGLNKENLNFNIPVV